MPRSFCHAGIASNLIHTCIFEVDVEDDMANNVVESLRRNNDEPARKPVLRNVPVLMVDKTGNAAFVCVFVSA